MVQRVAVIHLNSSIGLFSTPQKASSHSLCGVRGKSEATALVRSVLADQAQSREVAAFPEQVVELTLVHIGSDVGDADRHSLLLVFIYSLSDVFRTHIQLFYGCCEG